MDNREKKIKRKKKKCIGEGKKKKKKETRARVRYPSERERNKASCKKKACNKLNITLGLQQIVDSIKDYSLITRFHPLMLLSYFFCILVEN